MKLRNILNVYDKKNTIFVCQGVNPGVVRTDLYEASGMSADEVERLFATHAAMRPENVAEAVEYALATPIDVQVQKVF
jgi:NADP-dependent 3-hydroxy acid dehydrogenase YdfG